MWWWVMIWTFLLLVAGVYLGTRLWRLWGQIKELGSELASAERRLDAVQGQIELLGERISSTQDLAVFADPATVRKERNRVRAASRHARQQRREASRPGWARHVD
jgi:hypothetical protein